MPSIEITVQGLGSGGVGIGSLPNGKVVFLPRTAPGVRFRGEVPELHPLIQGGPLAGIAARIAG